MLKANAIKFPSPCKITITNYSLYKEDIVYNFVQGINLVVGGNGTGKTTFINILKFAIIGLYKSDFVVRTYKSEKIERRDPYPYDYFSSRKKKDDLRSNPRVMLEFDVGGILFTVIRNLETVTLEEVRLTVNGNTTLLKGNVIEQKLYDRLTNNTERSETLQYRYEQILVDEMGLSSFEDLILFVNDLLMFDERRKTVLWNSHFQTMLLGRYFNDPELSRRFDELLRDAKYNDSLSRHKSEDARAVRKILESYDTDALSLSDSKAIELQKEIEVLNRKINDLINDEKQILYTLSAFFGNQARVKQAIDEKELIISNLSINISKKIWEKTNPKYENYWRMIEELNTCPMCNTALSGNFKKPMNRCFLCGNELFNDKIQIVTENIDQENEALTLLRKELVNIERSIVENERKLDQNKNQLLTLKMLHNKKQIQLHNVENSKKPKNFVSQLDYVKQQYDSLLLERDKFKNIALECESKANEIASAIDNQRVQITKELSRYFESYATRFTGIISCYLKYGKDEEGIKRYIPVIGGINRLNEESLSESQRFFIDHSFRMSVLEYFYTAPSFFICETPESSLDLSYEENAAQIFMQYVDKPNVLVLTLNLNNNRFLKHIVNDRSHKINYLNLLKYGYCSSVQENSPELKTIANEIEDSIYGRQ